MIEPQVGSEYIVNGPPLDPRNGTKAVVTEKRAADMWRVRFDDGVYGLVFTDELSTVPEPTFRFVITTLEGRAGSLYWEGTDFDSVANERIGQIDVHAFDNGRRLAGALMTVTRLDEIIPNTMVYTLSFDGSTLRAHRRKP